MPLPVRRALLSVSDKTGLIELARGLTGRGVELLSTGGTARLLAENGIPVREVAQHTGFPEIMAGRLKTLHPKIHGGLLGRRGTDEAVMAEYGGVLAELAAHGGGSEFATRARLAAKAFAHTARYDTMVAAYLTARHPEEAAEFPATLPLVYEKLQDLRYGENPHQRAAFYRDPGARGAGVASAHTLQGKDLSFNNIADADTAIECVRQFAAAACVIVKHANPCGVAVAPSIREAYEAAYRTDPTS